MGLMNGLDKDNIIYKIPGGQIILGTAEWAINISRSNSLWTLTFGTACCAIEMMHTGATKFDWARFGLEVPAASPRRSDVMVIAGTIVEKMAPTVRMLYEQMAEPRYVMAMGSCAISGGPYLYDSYTIVKGVDKIIPVDIYIPGCPPRPESLLYGFMQLQKKIMQDKFLTGGRK